MAVIKQAILIFNVSLPILFLSNKENWQPHRGLYWSNRCRRWRVMTHVWKAEEMKELNTEAYVSCLTLISASGNSSTAINLGQELMGGSSLCEQACSDRDCLLALTERWLGKSDVTTQSWHKIHNESSVFLFKFSNWSDFSLALINSKAKEGLEGVGQECGQAGRQRGECFGEVQRWYEQFSGLWCFLAGFRQQLTIWWSGNTGLFKSPAHPGPSRLALQ